MVYLDPKNDLTFRKVFGQHPLQPKSYLNALLPLEVPIKDLKYLPADLVPVIPLLKSSSVDVSCIDDWGRQLTKKPGPSWMPSDLPMIFPIRR